MDSKGIDNEKRAIQLLFIFYIIFHFFNLFVLRENKCKNKEDYIVSSLITMDQDDGRKNQTCTYLHRSLYEKQFVCGLQHVPYK
jgi:hypothetical protein